MGNLTKRLIVFNLQKKRFQLIWKQRIQKILSCRQGIKVLLANDSRSYKMLVSTILMIFVSFIPYLNVPIGMFFDLKEIKLNRFANADAAFWTFSMCISPLLVLAVSQLKPFWMSYIVTIYVNISMLLGFLFLELNVDISSDWVFRLLSLVMSVLVFFVVRTVKSFFNLLRLKEVVADELKSIKYAQ